MLEWSNEQLIVEIWKEDFFAYPSGQLPIESEKSHKFFVRIFDFRTEILM